MSCDEAVIEAAGLGKTFRIFDHPADRLKQALSLGRRRYHREFTALREVSFTVRRGETMGVIGVNGSGKSTLLQLVCGILRPTTGSIRVHGRVSALLELGAGFNPEFTGRENVLFQGALMGVEQRVMLQRFDEIAAFADIGEFMQQPVWTYSSGMFVRLAFAVAVHVDPQVLVVDEAMAVGDAQFQAQGFRRIQEMRERGASIIFVSHATDQVLRLCDRAMLLDHGALVEIGEPRQVVNHYLSSVFMARAVASAAQAAGEGFEQRPGYNPGEYRFGSRAAEIRDFELQPALAGGSSLRVTAGERVTLRYRVLFHQAVAQATFAVGIATLDGMNVFGVNSRDLPGHEFPGSFAAGDVVDACFELQVNLARGDYLVSLSVSEAVSDHLTPVDRRYDAVCLAVDSPLRQRGLADLQPGFSLHVVDDGRAEAAP